MHDLDMKQEWNLTLKVWGILSELDMHTWSSFSPVPGYIVIAGINR